MFFSEETIKAWKYGKCISCILNNSKFKFSNMKEFENFNRCQNKFIFLTKSENNRKAINLLNEIECFPCCFYNNIKRESIFYSLINLTNKAQNNLLSLE